MKKVAFNIYECIKNFPNDDFKKMHRKEKDGRMWTRLQALYHLKNGGYFLEILLKLMSCEWFFCSNCLVSGIASWSWM